MRALPKLGPETTAPHTPLSGGAFVGALLAGKYEVVRVIGVGGMGVVCEARHRELGGRRFAIKLVQRYFAGSDIAMARFRREVRAVAAIESEHIVQVTDVGTDDKFGLFMVMEYLQGEDLATALHQGGAMRAAEAARIAHQIARGLAKAHAARILHRDLKPGNVFIVRREDGTPCVKIFDFGISKLLGDPDKSGTWSADLTGVGMPVGTPQYMSPEQAQGLSDLDPRTDVWSLGAVLFEMLAGRSPYQPRGRAHHTMMRILTEDPPPLESVAPWVPPSLARVVNAALMRDRDARIPDCQSFADLLEQAMPHVFGKPDVRPRSDDEVTVVTSIPTPVPAPVTPLAELLEPEAPSAPGWANASDVTTGPSSHRRLAQLPAIAPLPARARARGPIGVLTLFLALALGFACAGHAAKTLRAPAPYVVAPAR